MPSQIFVTPSVYSRVESSLTRGSKPIAANFPFLKVCEINTIIALTPISIYEKEDDDLIKFIQDNSIKYYHFATDSSVKNKGKNRQIPITHEQVNKILSIILMKNSGNIYVYCNNGGQITSLVIACLRKLQLWSNVSIFDEFICYSESANHNDRSFVEQFIPNIEINRSEKIEWLWRGLNESVILNHPSLKQIVFVE